MQSLTYLRHEMAAREYWFPETNIYVYIKAMKSRRNMHKYRKQI